MSNLFYKTMILQIWILNLIHQKLLIWYLVFLLSIYFFKLSQWTGSFSVKFTISSLLLYWTNYFFLFLSFFNWSFFILSFNISSLTSRVIFPSSTPYSTSIFSSIRSDKFLIPYFKILKDLVNKFIDKLRRLSKYLVLITNDILYSLI